MGTRHNIYQGPRSCYAIKEGFYVTGRGVDAKTAVNIAGLIMYDLKRGYTYDHYCRKIPMTPALAKKRLFYLIALARKHRGEKEARNVAELVRFIWRTKRLPRLIPLLIGGRRLWVGREILLDLRVGARPRPVPVHAIRRRVRRIRA